MIIELRLTDDEVNRIASRLAELLKESAQPTERWLDVAAAAAHVGLTEHSIRGLVKRRKVPVHRTLNGRLLFSAVELNDWVRSGGCEPTNEDLA